MFDKLPEPLRATMHSQSRLALDLQERVAAWQLGQIEIAREQLAAQTKLGQSAVKATLDASGAWRRALVEGLTPAAAE